MPGYKSALSQRYLSWRNFDAFDVQLRMEGGLILYPGLDPQVAIHQQIFEMLHSLCSIGSSVHGLQYLSDMAKDMLRAS